MNRILPLLGLLSTWGAQAALAQCPAPTVTSNGAASVCNGQVSLITTLGANPVRYAASVLRFSTEYSSSWAASMATGTPNVYPQHGDISGTWASSAADGTREYLVLRFDNPAPAKRILIWETYNPGAIDTVFVRNPSTNAWVPVYTATAAAAGSNSRILNINFPLTTFAVRDVRLAINSAAVPGWNEIDAVALSDEAATYQWQLNGVDLAASVTGANGPGLSNISTTGAYSVRVTNDASCTATSAPFNIMADTAPSVTISPAGSTTICSGGSTTLTATGTNNTASVAGRGLRFDGTDDVASVPASNSLNLTSALTMEAWINPVGTGAATQDVVCKSSQSANTGYIFPRTDTRWDDLAIWLHINGSWRVFSTPYTAYKGSWHHVAASYDGSRVKIFIDGAKVLDQALTGTVATNGNALALGNQPGYAEYYNGQLDEVRLWNVARSEAQVQADYNKTVLGTQPGLVAYYRLDEGNGTAFVDQTANANNGTLGSGSTTPTWINNTATIRQGLAYTWTPATGLSGTTTAAVLANPTATTTYRVRATNVNSGCFAEASVVVNVGGQFSWSGAVSTDWNNAANWACGVVPTAADNITIPAGMPRYPIISANASVGSITILSGGTVSLTGGNFSVMGQFTNSGFFNQTGGTVSLLGATPNDLGGLGTDFGNLSVGSAGARMTAALRVQGLLTLNGNLNVNGQALTLLSNGSGTASVYNNGGVVQGTATVQRWISPAINAGPGYRHLAAPVSGSTVADLGTGLFTPVVNPAYNAAANPGTVTPFPTVFGYNEQRLTATANTFDTGWESPASTADALTPGRGYTVQLTQQTVDFVGTLGNGAVNIPLTRGTAAPGWNLVGNPYPSPLDWALVTIPTGMNAAAYVYRSTGPYAGGYISYVNGVGAPGAQLIPLGQAFFVRAATGTPTLALNNTARVTTLENPALNRTQEIRPLLELALTAPNAAGAAAREDVLFVYQQAGATLNFDGRYDALKVQLNGGQQPTLYQQAGADALSIQGLPDGNQPVDLPLGLYAPAAGTYTFAARQLVNFPTTAAIYLEDRLSGTWHDLRQGDYAAQLAAGASTTRFVLHLNAQRVTSTQNAHLAGTELHVFPNPAQGRTVTVSAVGLTGGQAELRLLNSLGQLVRRETAPLSGRLLEHQLSVEQLPAGVYTVQVRTAAGSLTHKLVLN
ncbi:LamG-like jellyroll fold domain-containing protein [Hymenobacter jeollabukensis]|uniref:T9SS type A sorting domain-containing protein n=1 Tax=Hymenobacter jeollabukensis TaxID=2025313 RepID=A0A5R8WXI6_9BACT|nr:LamG-like jellyroll fold domain-containing protein [Hymenobacter jeollabukensis]TLM96942.1 T9SS type A sorting domain-containing protein [Hymenobacter jeollabukensis]